MPDQVTSQIAHLYRRAGFAATPAEMQASVARGYGATVDYLLDAARVDPVAIPDPVVDYSTYVSVETVEERKARNKVRQEQRQNIVEWWLEKMTVSEQPVVEKRTLFWHDHFATSIEKVDTAILMYEQNKVFRRLGGGRFEDLTQAVAKDVAMMIWLDSNRNVKNRPNENFGRELMELFTIGIGNYSDNDVREASRAFAGWRSSPTGGFTLNPKQSDPGVKTILGQTGAFTGEQVISQLTNSEATAKFIARKMFSFYAFPAPSEHPAVAQLATGFAKDFNITNLQRALFLHPAFQSTEARQGLVKQPIEWLIGMMRQLGLRPTSLPPGKGMQGNLRRLNQEPFAPPSVGGWPDNGYWISTASALTRHQTAIALTNEANLDWLSSAAPPQRADVLAQRLTVDGWTPSTLNAIKSVTEPRQQLIAALISPEYVLN
jgi:uncharacterized protein (DUF1800 family)